MKKSKLSIGLVTSFIGALAMSSCSTESVTPSKSSVVDILGYNSSSDRLEINVDELYREYGESKEGTTKYYNAILESLIRYEYPKLASDDNPKEPELKKFSRIKAEAADKLVAVQRTARDNAKNNGTDYEDEWDKILESHDVETTEELRLKFVYELEKEAITDWYFKNNFEAEGSAAGLRQQYIGVTATEDAQHMTSDWEQIDTDRDDVEPVYPYHVVHILVKLSADASDYTRATISESEAEKLWNIVSYLIDGNLSFEDVAVHSDDTSSSEYGDVELMSTRTSFYNEFKLGTYAFDAILSNNNEQEDGVNDKLYKAFGVDDDAEIVLKSTNDGGFLKEEKGKIASIWQDEDGYDHNSLIQETMLDNVNVHLEEAQSLLPAIPFDVFRQIGLMAKEDKIGTFTPEGSQASLPRNVLFNAFLNFRSPFVITNELLDQTSVHFDSEEHLDSGTPNDPSDDMIAITPLDNDAATIPYDFKDPDIYAVERNNFQTGKLGTGFPADKGVLCDNKGNVVIGVRSTAGIHFMVMRKSVFENTNKKAYEKAEWIKNASDEWVIDEANSVKKTHTSLEDYYYTAKIPTDKDYDNDHETYVNIKNVNDSSYYTNRVNTIKNDVKSSNFDAAFDYRLYETLLSYPLFNEGQTTVEEKLHFSDEKDGKSTIKSNIEKTIKQLRESAKYSQEESINKAWTEYLLQLMNQNELRSEQGMYQGAFVPTTCAFSFNKDNQDEWKEGGKCYVK